MDFDALQQIWRDQPQQERQGGMQARTEAVDSIVTRVKRLERQILVRDAIEAATAAAMAGICVWMALLVPTGWPWIAAAILVLGVGGFLVVDRLRRRRGIGAAVDLRSALRHSLDDVERRMRLLRSVTSWYLAPLAAAILLILGGTVWDLRAEMPAEDSWGAWTLVSGTIAVTLLVVGLVFRLVRGVNLQAVECGLTPERNAIASILEDLDEPADAGG